MILHKPYSAHKVALYFFVLFCSQTSFGQNPEIAMREFASGQIKKGVRSIGMGGDGATWGNYSLIWRDSCTALFDAGVTGYSNQNAFSFTAVGVTTPSLWRGLTVYVIALSQYANNIGCALKAPQVGATSSPVHGDGNDQAVFLKAAMPLKNGFSIGILLSYERSQFNSTSTSTPVDYSRYHTNWLPSGGFGLTWQPVKRILIGFRALFNHDLENRIDTNSSLEGYNFAHEYRLGISVGCWKGALIDIGGNVRYHYNEIYKNKHTDIEPNIGFEQNLWHNHFAVRCGLDETSGTGGFSIRIKPIILDVAYVHDLGISRVGPLFGTTSNSTIITLAFDYGGFRSKRS